MESEEKLNAWVHKLAQPPMGLLGLFPAARGRATMTNGVNFISYMKLFGVEYKYFHP
jgi:hypothetical protein